MYVKRPHIGLCGTMFCTAHPLVLPMAAVGGLTWGVSSNRLSVIAGGIGLSGRWASAPELTGAGISLREKTIYLDLNTAGSIGGHGQSVLYFAADGTAQIRPEGRNVARHMDD